VEIFELSIQARDQQVGLFQAVAQGEKADAEEVVFVPDKIFLENVNRLQERGPERFQDTLSQEKTCAAVGQQLFSSFFRGKVLDRFRSYRSVNSPPRIALTLPRSLYYLPWEVLQDTIDPMGQFLSMYGSVVRFDAESKQPNDVLFVNTESELNLLLVLASTVDRPIAQFELDGTERINLHVVRPASYDQFERTAKRNSPCAGGFVFFGHGVMDGQYGALMFTRNEWRRLARIPVGDPKRGNIITDAIGPDNKMLMACLFACESAWAREEVTFERSVAGSILVRTWLPFVIGAQIDFDFAAATEFLDRFLVALEDGSPLDIAMGLGRKAVKALDQKGVGQLYSCLDWWVPVLYARTNNFLILPDKDALSFPLPSPGDSPPSPQFSESKVRPADVLKAYAPRIKAFFSSEREENLKALRSGASE